MCVIERGGYRVSPYYAAPTWNDGARAFRQLSEPIFGTTRWLFSLRSTPFVDTPSQCGHCARSIVFVRAHSCAFDGTHRRTFIHAARTLWGLPFMGVHDAAVHA